MSLSKILTLVRQAGRAILKRLHPKFAHKPIVTEQANEAPEPVGFYPNPLLVNYFELLQLFYSCGDWLNQQAAKGETTKIEQQFQALQSAYSRFVEARDNITLNVQNSGTSLEQLIASAQNPQLLDKATGRLSFFSSDKTAKEEIFKTVMIDLAQVIAEIFPEEHPSRTKANQIIFSLLEPQRMPTTTDLKEKQFPFN